MARSTPRPVGMRQMQQELVFRPRRSAAPLTAHPMARSMPRPVGLRQMQQEQEMLLGRAVLASSSPPMRPPMPRLVELRLLFLRRGVCLSWRWSQWPLLWSWLQPLQWQQGAAAGRAERRAPTGACPGMILTAGAKHQSLTHGQMTLGRGPVTAMSTETQSRRRKCHSCRVLWNGPRSPQRASCQGHLLPAGPCRCCHQGGVHWCRPCRG
mmetsp:Transcript_17625/g.48672  ORF Transcript_17625/g.48672 Transcript_17625/m.48672 type:complete len:210 (-) Transcript_17625:551-1180(-)